MAVSLAYTKAFTLTQGGADTAAETTLATNLLPGVDMAAWELLELEFTVKPDLVKAWASADADFTIQMTKRSLAGAIARIVTFTDNDLILSWSLAAILSGTAANLFLLPTTYRVSLPAGIIVYTENLYMQIISTGTGQTNVAWGRLLYQPVKLTASDAMVLIASRP